MIKRSANRRFWDPRPPRWAGWVWVALTVLCFQITHAAAAAEGPAVEPREKWSAVFGDQELKLGLVVSAPKVMKGRLSWQFIIGPRTVARGDEAVAAGPDKPAVAEVRLPVPPVRDGVVLGARVVAAFYADGQGEPAATLDKPLWIFPPNAFADRKQWLRGLKITLFDPEEKTAAVFRKASIPFEETVNAAALTELHEGLLIIGEGVSFKDHPDLPATLIRVAARGLPVLCLAPRDGVFPVPGADTPKLPAPASLSWRRQDVITELDKRLDARAWPGDNPIVASRIALGVEDDRVVGKVETDGEGWPWMQAHFAGGQGRFLVCGFGIVRSWDAAPTPRYLLVRLIETMTVKTESESPKEKEPEK